jgi:hypothetical protein
MTTKTWNTGRLYAADGQVIVATRHDDGVVTFMDHSRGIDGELNVVFSGKNGLPFDLQAVVMNAYDHNNYKGSRRAWQDGMLGGCNARK